MSARIADVAVILVGRNSRRYVQGCLESLAKAEWDGLRREVIYVDNGSTDGTLDMIAAEHPDVRTLGNAENLGFCRAANQGAGLARARHLAFLNDDTLVLGDALSRVVRLLEREPGIGVVGSRLLYPDLSEQWSGRRFPSPWNGILGRRSVLSRLFPNSRVLVRYLYKEELRRGEPFAVDWVSAAAMTVRSDVYEAVGGCAEDYYYWHEAVLCDRVRRAGYQVYLHPGSRIIHFEGKGSGARPYEVQKWHIQDFHQGAYRCYCEHHELSRWSPRRAFAAAALGARRWLLLARTWLDEALRRPETEAREAS